MADVTCTLNMVKDGQMKSYVKTLPYGVYVMRVQGPLLALENEAHNWSIETAMGLPNTFGDDADGNFEAKLVADGGPANWRKEIEENGIPQAAADYLASRVDAIMNAV